MLNITDKKIKESLGVWNILFKFVPFKTLNAQLLVIYLNMTWNLFMHSKKEELYLLN